MGIDRFVIKYLPSTSYLWMQITHTTHKRKREKTNLGGIDRFQVHFCGKQLICTQLVMQQNVICRSTYFHTDHLSFPYSWGPSSGINAPLGDFATSGPHKLVTKSRPTVLCLLVWTLMKKEWPQNGGCLYANHHARIWSILLQWPTIWLLS